MMHSFRTQQKYAFFCKIFLFLSILYAYPDYHTHYSNSRFEVEVEQASTRFAFYEVKLSVSDFVLSQQGAFGSYEIEVSAAPWKNESGSIHFDMHLPVEELKQQGGVLEGYCIRDREHEASHTVVCYIEPQQFEPVAGALHLKVKTKKRELTFNSNYVIRASSQ